MGFRVLGSSNPKPCFPGGMPPDPLQRISKDAEAARGFGLQVLAAGYTGVEQGYIRITERSMQTTT